MEQRIRTELREFVVSSYLFGDTTRVPGDDVSLVGEGIIDSTGILELIEFLEQQYVIEVTETETVPDNLGSISNLARFVLAKLNTSQLGTPAAAGHAG